MTRPTLAGPDHVAAAPFARLNGAQAAEILRTVYGLEPAGEPVRLATERDDTFRLATAEGEFILKIAPPDDDPLAINLQTQALEYAAGRDRGLPLQRVHPARDGSKEPLIPTGDGVRVARLLTYLSGTLLRHASPTPAQLQACGRVQALLAAALEGFDHPAADRHLLFDLQNFAELRGLLPLDDSGLTAAVFHWFDDVFTAQAATLPRQVLHTDFGLDNVLVSDAAPDYVTGVLDWGDVVRTWRAGDLASGLASQIATDGPGWARAAAMLDGYQAVQPLKPAELDLLPGLVAMRLAQRILLAEWLSASMPSNADYLGRNLTTSYQQLANLQY